MVIIIGALEEEAVLGLLPCFDPRLGEKKGYLEDMKRVTGSCHLRKEWVLLIFLLLCQSQVKGKDGERGLTSWEYERVGGISRGELPSQGGVGGLS